MHVSVCVYIYLVICCVVYERRQTWSLPLEVCTLIQKTLRQRVFKSKTLQKTIIQIVLHSYDPLPSKNLGLGLEVSLHSGIKAQLGKFYSDPSKKSYAQALDFCLPQVRRGPGTMIMLHLAFLRHLQPGSSAAAPLLFLNMALVECHPCHKLTEDTTAHCTSSDLLWERPGPPCLHPTCLNIHPYTFTPCWWCYPLLLHNFHFISFFFFILFVSG